jgi:UDP-N-acetylglucosamine enolpyruvyl transferase
VTLRNVPRIRDVETMVELLVQLGADADWTGANEVRVQAADLAYHGRRRTSSQAASARRSCWPARCSLVRPRVGAAARAAT